MEINTKTQVDRLRYMGIIRIALSIFMLFTIFHLFGDIGIINHCPLELGYKVTPLDGKYTVGSRFLFTFTISMNPDRVTEYDKRRAYQINSSYFTNEKEYGSLRTIKTDIQSGETFTYSQFPITKHLTVKVFDDVGSGQIDVNAEGYAVEGCPDPTIQEQGKDIQQQSYFYMFIPVPSEIYQTYKKNHNSNGIETDARTHPARNAHDYVNKKKYGAPMGLHKRGILSTIWYKIISLFVRHSEKMIPQKLLVVLGIIILLLVINRLLRGK